MNRRRLALVGVLLAVMLVHLGVLREVDDDVVGLGRADRPPPRIRVNFVRELAPTTPPVAVVAAAPPSMVRRPAAAPPRKPAASDAQAAASASEKTASADKAPPAAEAPASDPVLDQVMALVGAAGAPASRTPAASEPAPAGSAAAAAPPASAAQGVATTAGAASMAAATPADTFDWPPSTRLSYRLTGHWRGPLYGSAQVEWLRDGDRYQVIMDVHIPPGMNRRSASEGTLGPDGLTPRRYDDETSVPLREVRRNTVHFEGNVIKLANGELHERWPGVQDQASQFVQLAWLFAAKPELLQVGRTVELPLALPRRVGRWVYDIAEVLPVTLPFGDVPAFHLKPRTENRRPNEIAVDMWIAPSLQYLPVRLELRLDSETFLELTLSGKPLQAAPAGPAPLSAEPARPRL